MKVECALVTGCAGFIGSHLVNELVKRGIKTIGIDNLCRGTLKNIKAIMSSPLFKFIQADVTKSLDLKDASVVFHEAALVDMEESFIIPDAYYDVNVRGTLNLLEAMRKQDLDRIIYASSSSIYGEPKNLPIGEDELPKPTSPYALTKLMGEHLIQFYYNAYGFKTTILRYFNVYGEGQTQASHYSGVIAKFINDIGSKSAIEIFGDGTQTRDFIHVNDAVEASIRVAERDNTTGKVYNVGTGVPLSIIELAKKIINLCRKDVRIEFHSRRKGDITNSYANVERVVRDLEFQPKISIDEGLRKLFLSHRAKVEDLQENRGG